MTEEMLSAEKCVDLLREMVAIPSQSQNEKEMAVFILRYLKEELGMEAWIQPVGDRGANVIGRWKNPKAARRLILGGHLDTVPPADGWETDPYTLCQQGETLHGLGAADMKGGLAAQLLVLKQLRADKDTLDVEIEFVGLADEERYSMGAHAYVTWARTQGDARPCFFIMGEPHFHNIVIGATGKVLLSLSITGKEGHAAVPESGANAIELMARLLEEIQQKYGPSYREGKTGSACCLKIEGGAEGYSMTIPAQCRCLLNKQLLAGEEIDEFIADIQRLYREKIGIGALCVSKEIPSYPAYRLPSDQPDTEKLKRFLKERFQHQPQFQINQSVSDGNIFYNLLAIPTILFGPDGTGFHTEKECLNRASLERYMRELLGYIRMEYSAGERRSGEERSGESVF